MKQSSANALALFFVLVTLTVGAAGVLFNQIVLQVAFIFCGLFLILVARYRLKIHVIEERRKVGRLLGEYAKFPRKK